MPRPFATAPDGARGHSTAIYFLLEQDQTVGLAPGQGRGRGLALLCRRAAGAVDVRGRQAVIEQVLGIELAAGERPQIVVPAGWWQSARSLGEWTLVGCTVAPGFDFAAFELAEPGWQPLTQQESPA